MGLIWACSAWMEAKVWLGGGGGTGTGGRYEIIATVTHLKDTVSLISTRPLNIMFTLQTRKLRIRENGPVCCGTQIPNLQAASPPARLRLSGLEGFLPQAPLGLRAELS